MEIVELTRLEKQQVKRLSGAKVGQDRRHDRAGRIARECADRDRQQQQRTGKDGRDYTRWVNFDGKM